MWNRQQIKQNAKKILKRNYWIAVCVAIILGWVSSSGSSVNFGNNSTSSSESNLNMQNLFGNNKYKLEDSFDENYNEKSSNDNLLEQYAAGDLTTDEFIKRYSEENQAFYRYYTAFNEFKASLAEKNIDMGTVIAILAGIIVFVSILSIILSLFVFMPVTVGCKRWFVINSTDNPQFGEIAHPFKNGYLNVVKTMFLVNLYTFLWSLLFVIPGIIKAYEYRMVPYLLAENPEMDSREAFRISKEMMDGNKWDVFVYDLSFLGWHILSAITWSIVGVFFVGPYKAIADAELYITLCQRRSNNVNGYENQFNNGGFTNRGYY